MRPTLLSDLETLYGLNARRGEVFPFVRRRPLPPAERWRRAVDHSLRLGIICGDTVYGAPLPPEEDARVFPQLVDAE